MCLVRYNCFISVKWKRKGNSGHQKMLLVFLLKLIKNKNIDMIWKCSRFEFLTLYVISRHRFFILIVNMIIIVINLVFWVWKKKVCGETRLEWLGFWSSGCRRWERDKVWEWRVGKRKRICLFYVSGVADSRLSDSTARIDFNVNSTHTYFPFICFHLCITFCLF